MKRAVRERLFRNDWFSFWENYGLENNLSLMIGLVFVLVCSMMLGLIGSQRVTYARQFYDLAFEINFLEDIQPGTKVRYQGALVVGEVKFIERRENRIFAVARIKKDFRIPKKGSNVSLQTWGYFGGKFINIAIIEGFADYEAYSADSTVPVEEVTNSTIMLQKFYAIIKAEGTNELSPLEAKLVEIRNFSRNILNHPFIRPSFIRGQIQQVTGSAKSYFQAFNNMSEESLPAFEGFNMAAGATVASLRKNLPGLRKSMSEIRDNTLYKPQIDGLSTRLWHEETAYFEAVSLAGYFARQLDQYRMYPYLIIFKE